MVLKAKEVRDEMRKGIVPEFSMRHRLGLSLEFGEISVNEMAEHLGASRTTVSNYLHGRTHPRRPDLVVWSMVTNVPFDWLVEGVVPDITPETASDSRPKRARKQVKRPSLWTHTNASHDVQTSNKVVDSDVS
jgi:transcriptional regulator with XRE-family HTH domain